MHICPCRNIFS